MEIEVNDKQTEPKEGSSWQKLLLGKPWWGLTVLLFGLATVFTSLGETCLTLGVSATAGLFSMVVGLLVTFSVLTFLLGAGSFVYRLLGFAKSIPKPKNSRLVKYGSWAFGVGILLSTINVSVVAIPNVQANTWTAKPLINHENVWIETPGTWEAQNSNPFAEHYYDATHDLTIVISVVSKQDAAAASLKQVSQNSVKALSQSLGSVRVVHTEEYVRDGQRRLLTEFQGEGSNQMLLHFVLNHIDLDGHWLEVRFFAFPSKIESARDTINRFMDSLHTRS